VECSLTPAVPEFCVVTMDTKTVWKDVADDYFLTAKTITALTKEDIITVEDFLHAYHSPDGDLAYLRAAGINVGQMRRLRHMGGIEDRVNEPPEPQEKPQEKEKTPDLDAQLFNLSEADIAEVKKYDQLDQAGKLMQYLTKKDPESFVDESENKSVDHHSVSTNKVTFESKNVAMSANDPRANLIVNNSSNVKVHHITDFLSQDTKKRLKNRKEKVLCNDGGKLTVDTKDEHPYMGISILEYGSANMSLLFFMLQNKVVDRKDIEYYLAYTKFIYELGEKFVWNDVMKYDYIYRIRQAEMQFQWNSQVALGELTLLTSTPRYEPLRDDRRDRRDRRRFDNRSDRRFDNRSDRRFDNRSEEKNICRLFAANGVCPYSPNCRFTHVSQPPRNQGGYAGAGRGQEGAGAGLNGQAPPYRPNSAYPHHPPPAGQYNAPAQVP